MAFAHTEEMRRWRAEGEVDPSSKAPVAARSDVIIAHSRDAEAALSDPNSHKRGEVPCKTRRKKIAEARA